MLKKSSKKETMTTSVIVRECGIDLQEYQNSTSMRSNTLKILAIGRFVEKKGFAYLIEAARILQNKIDFNLTIIGDGALQGKIVSMIDQYGLSDKVTLLGSQPQERIKDALQHASLFVLPSVESSTGEMEGIPVVIMEAMALGVPVIATRHAGIPEIVVDEETGLLVPEKDPEQLAEAIIRMAKNRALRKKCIKHAYENVSAEFDISEIAHIKAKIFSESI